MALFSCQQKRACLQFLAYALQKLAYPEKTHSFGPLSLCNTPVGDTRNPGSRDLQFAENGRIMQSIV
jgi:hypothetical protein